MKIVIFFILVSFNCHAGKLFIEPSFFMNMMDSAHADYHSGDKNYSGFIRNRDISYAFKFGAHFGHYEIGIESEIYNFVAHFKDQENGDFTKNIQLTYNSLFVGYEFIKHQFLYLAVSNHPFMSSSGKSFVERKNVFSLEYSYHIKEWVSLNIKVETESELEGGDSETFGFGNLLMLGFSFPLIQEV